MKIQKWVIVSVIWGIIMSFGSSFLFFNGAGMVAGGMLWIWGESWLYYATLLPFLITFLLLGRYFSMQEKVSNKQLWKISLVTAFFVTWFSGTIGAIIGEYIVRGEMQTINVDGTLIWGTIYAVVLLPLTTPFARVILGMFRFILKKTGV